MKKHEKIRKDTKAFTLLELLVAVGIILVLATLGVTVAKKSIQAADKAKEMNAGRNLISAYQNAANDHDGRFIPAYLRNVQEEDAITLPDGTAVTGEALNRYPYRLAPYFQYQIKGVILAGENAKRIDVGQQYQVSLYPSFGINEIFVGGKYDGSGENPNIFESETVTTRADASSSIIAFVTASQGGGTADDGRGPMPGFHRVGSPNTDRPVWNANGWTKDSDPADFGQIDARYDNKAIIVFLDGSVRMMSIEELDDMRLWCVGAAAADDPDYMAKAVRGSGRGR